MLVIANTFPKSGTGLLRQMLAGILPDQGHIGQFDGHTGAQRSPQVLKAAMELVRHGGFLTAHLHWNPIYQDIDAAWLFLYRDPRAVAVSHAHYILNTPGHSLHYQYKDLGSLDRCIQASIEGLPGVLPDIGQRFLPYVPWLPLKVKRLAYEWLVEDPFNEAVDLAEYLKLDPPEHAAIKMLADLDPKKSATFRSGETDGWKQEINSDNRALFDRVAGWLVDLLGYE